MTNHLKIGKQRRRSGLLRANWAIIFDLSKAVLIALIFVQSGLAQSNISFPLPAPSLQVSANADRIDRWQQGSWDIYGLQGNVNIRQGPVAISGDQAVVWVDRNPGDSVTSLLLYLEQNVVVEIENNGPRHIRTGKQTSRFVEHTWLGRLNSRSGIQINNIVQNIALENAPAIFQRGMARRQQELENIATVQHVVPVISPVTGQTQQVVVPNQQFDSGVNPPSNSPFIPSVPDAQPTVSQTPQTVRTDVVITGRNNANGGNLKRLRGDQPGQWIYVKTGGTKVIITSTELAERDQFGQPQSDRLTIETDNVVRWETPIVYANGTTGTREELYLEGDIVFAQGNRVIFADRMYYDATAKRGTILNADVLTPVPSYKGLLRMKADVVQQLDENNLQAYGAAITSSRLGVPRYWLQSDQLNLTRIPGPSFDPVSGLPLVNPATGQAVDGDDYFVRSNDNRLYLAGIPVFYWPTLNTDLQDPNYYIERIRVSNDNVFGNQIGIGVDLFQLLGIRNQPENGRWVGNLDYLSERGFGFGTDGDYSFSSFLGYPGPASGFFRSWFIDDNGLDNLGLDRRAVPLEEDFRGRALWRHRHDLANGFTFRGEFGFLSDQNFLQQFFEREWDQDKDYTTGVWIERNFNSQSWNLTANTRINDFFTQTEWLPRGDHFVIGAPTLFDRAVWHGRTHIGYGRFLTAEPPTNAIDLAKFDPLAFEGADLEGLVTGTRQEIDFPIQIGSAKVVPYLLGDASFWQQDLNGDDLFRLLGQAGIRSSVPLWNVDPTVQSTLLNLNGLAHKVTFESEFLYADASQDLGDVPLFNALDDDAQEFFRRRFAFDTFGIVAGQDVPLQFDERFFAFRSGLQRNITAPANEIADDLLLFRTGVRNRWQTKRGLPGEARIVDWITFDVHYNYYPDADRDNFGADFGMLDYDFRWHIGDRFTVVSDGFFEFFGQGLRTASIGANLARPGRGNLFVGFRTIEGPISSNVLSAAASYRMNDKWILRGSSSVDFSDAGNIGQSISAVRVGESFLVSVGVNADISRDNVGVLFSIEPRFLPTGRLGLVGGQQVSPASTTFLE